ncbi:MAG: nitroreductase family protein [Erysipelotrichaceae bacterium]
MNYQTSVIELIKTRKSVRTYEDKKIDTNSLQTLKKFISEINKQSKIKARYVIADNADTKKGTAVKLGTYGVISGADMFIVGIIDKDEKDTAEFGYQFEKIILCATDLGLSTCWLGGTFNKGSFERSVELGDNEIIPIVSPVGYGKGKRKLLESAMRSLAGSDQRKPWSEIFFNKDSSIALSESDAGNYALTLEMTRLAPSASNKQPWRVIMAHNRFDFYLARTPGYGSLTFDLQKNDVGIAMCHFELSALELGLKGNWKTYGSIETNANWEYVSTWEIE